MILASHNIRPQILIEKYDNCGILIEERELDTKYDANSFITAQKYSAENKLIKEEKFPVKSYVDNYFTALLAAFSGSTYRSTSSNADIDGIITQYNQFSRFSAGIPVNNTTVGIVVGKNSGGISTISSDSSSFTDYTLKNLILDGYISGTLFYGDSLYKNLYISESFAVISYSRIFSNLSTSSIDIKEIGMATGIQTNAVINPKLMFRDVTDYTGSSININLLPNESLYVNYNFLLNTSSLFPGYGLMSLIDTDGGTVNSFFNYTGFENFFSYRNSYRTGSVEHYGVGNTSIAHSYCEAEYINHGSDSGFDLTIDYPYVGATDKWLKFNQTVANRIVRNSKVSFGVGNAPVVSHYNVDVTYLTRAESTQSYSHGVYVRNHTVTGLSGTTGGQGGMSVHFNSSSLILLSTNSSTGQTIISRSLAKTYSKDTDYYIRYYASESVAKVKSWISGSESEPVGWEIDTITNCTGSRNVQPMFGLHNFYYALSTVQQTTYFNDFNIKNLDFQSISSSFCGTYVTTGLFVRQRMKINAGIGNDFCGIVVGTNDKTDDYELIPTAEASFFDFRLNRKILSGDKSGEVQYGSVNITRVPVTDRSQYMEINRQFVNNSSDPISINEVALYTTNNPNAVTVFNGAERCIGRVLTGAPIVLDNSESVIIRMRLYFDI